MSGLQSLLSSLPSDVKVEAAKRLVDQLDTEMRRISELLTVAKRAVCAQQGTIDVLRLTQKKADTSCNTDINGDLIRIAESIRDVRIYTLC